MNFRDFSATNRRRCEAANGFGHALNSWSLSDWFTATLGELGEAANIAKKLNRVRDGIPGNSETPEQLQAMLKDEIADAFIYLDLLAQSAGFNLQEAVVDKFNRTSAKIGYTAEAIDIEAGAPVTVVIRRFSESAADREVRDALAEVMRWIDNWNPTFEQDDEWVETRARVDMALAATAKAEAGS